MPFLEPIVPELFLRKYLCYGSNLSCLFNRFKLSLQNGGRSSIAGHIKGTFWI